MLAGKSTKFLAKSAKETQKIAYSLAKEILKMPPRKKAMVLALAGNLGSGKTTFLQGFARGLGVKEKILSPTFIIMRIFKNFYHIDCYRIQKPKDILDLGFKKIINDPKNIVAIEWADRIKHLLPKNRILIQFNSAGKNEREIVFTG
jgi:tRNA threonylcarbamoyladenosine biosynthesis protein TsaE